MLRILKMGNRKADHDSNKNRILIREDEREREREQKGGNSSCFLSDKNFWTPKTVAKICT